MISPVTTDLSLLCIVHLTGVISMNFGILSLMWVKLFHPSGTSSSPRNLTYAVKFFYQVKDPNMNDLRVRVFEPLSIRSIKSSLVAKPLNHMYLVLQSNKIYNKGFPCEGCCRFSEWLSFATKMA